VYACLVIKHAHCMSAAVDVPAKLRETQSPYCRLEVCCPGFDGGDVGGAVRWQDIQVTCHMRPARGPGVCPLRGRISAYGTGLHSSSQKIVIFREQDPEIPLHGLDASNARYTSSQDVYPPVRGSSCISCSDMLRQGRGTPARHEYA
jgi:hypothetical protein